MKPTGQSTRFSRSSFVGIVTLAAIAVAMVWMAQQGLSARLEYDEAYNLQVPESLRTGDGYSSFGALGSGNPWKFDPHITTGPVVLLPVAAIWSLSDGSVTAARALLAVSLLAFASAWWFLLRPLRGGLFVAGIALAFALAAAPAASARVLGELPGAALLVWTAVALARRRPALAAIAAGLAIQAKVVYGLAGVSMFGIWLLVAFWTGNRPTLRMLVTILLLAAAPSLLFEFFRLVAMGSPEKYLGSLGELREFMRGQKAPNWLDPALLGPKASGFFGTYPIFVWATLALATVVLLVRGAVFERDARAAPPQEEVAQREVMTALTALVVAGVALLLGWITQSLQTGVRQALPFFLLTVPAVVALCLLFAMRSFSEPTTGGRESRITRAVVTAGAGVLSITAFWSLSQSLQRVANDVYAQASGLEQRQVADAIRTLRPASLYAKGFWHNPEYQLLSGVRGTTRRTYDRQLLVVPDYQVVLSNTTWADHESKCGEVVRRTNFTLLCWLPDAQAAQLLKALDWGPQKVPLGTLPLPQPDGGSAFWFKIAPVVAEDVGPIRVHIGRLVLDGVLAMPNADLVTTVAPASLFMQAGSHEVALEQVSSGRRVPVGVLLVE